MDENQQGTAAMRAVTISREYGSGGGEIAARLARQLGWQLIDHQVVAQAARELGTPEAVVGAHDEKSGGLLDRLMQWPNPTSREEREAYYETIGRVVRSAADAGRAVIVGRGAQVLLADRPDVLHVRVVAPPERRVTYVALREALDRDGAAKRMQAKDQARARYMQARFHCQQDDPHLYDLVINTAVLDLDSAVDQIRLALEQKARRLGMPQEELGPAAGIGRYPGQPLDFPVSPES